MSGWLDPAGWPRYAIGICDRCHRRFPLHELIEDGNLPGLRVCREDWDELDPYRLPARQTEDISLPFVRPDVSIALPVTVTERFVRVTMDGDPRITISGETRVTGVPLPYVWPP